MDILFLQGLVLSSDKKFSQLGLTGFNFLNGARAYQLDFEITGLSYFKSLSFVLGGFSFLLSKSMCCMHSLIIKQVLRMNLQTITLKMKSFPPSLTFHFMSELIHLPSFTVLK